MCLWIYPVPIACAHGTSPRLLPYGVPIITNTFYLDIIRYFLKPVLDALILIGIRLMLYSNSSLMRGFAGAFGRVDLRGRVSPVLYFLGELL